MTMRAEHPNSIQMFKCLERMTLKFWWPFKSNSYKNLWRYLRLSFKYLCTIYNFEFL